MAKRAGEPCPAGQGVQEERGSSRWRSTFTDRGAACRRSRRSSLPVSEARQTVRPPAQRSPQWQRHIPEENAEEFVRSYVRFPRQNGARDFRQW